LDVLVFNNKNAESGILVTVARAIRAQSIRWW
jgi:hypothetical protein